MFQFRRFPAYAYLIQRTLTEYCSAGFPHSVISGSTAICASPKLIAACHDLHRLLMPRHSPCALISLTSSRRRGLHIVRSRLKPRTHSFRRASSLVPKASLSSPVKRAKGFEVPTPTIADSQELCADHREVQILAYCFLPVRVFHNFASFCLFCCLLFIFFVVQFSRCYLLISYLRPDRNV